jgi:hypothetical protein
MKDEPTRAQADRVNPQEQHVQLTSTFLSASNWAPAAVGACDDMLVGCSGLPVTIAGSDHVRAMTGVSALSESSSSIVLEARLLLCSSQHPTLMLGFQGANNVC